MDEMNARNKRQVANDNTTTRTEQQQQHQHRPRVDFEMPFITPQCTAMEQLKKLRNPPPPLNHVQVVT
ncbi:hypothetical protein FF2_020088 [Malus domestica]